MVKVESGLFNRLSGTLQKSRTTFQTRKTGIVAEKKPIPPPDPRGRRECIRWIYRYLCDKWNTLSEQEKEQYSETAEKHNITLFNAFLKEELTPRLWKCKLSKIDGQVLYLPFVEGEGNSLRDFSGQNNHGTIIDATWQKDEKKVYLDFDGEDDYVVIPESDSLTIQSDLTIEVWANFKRYASPVEYQLLVHRDAPEATDYALCVTRNNLRLVYLGNGEWRALDFYPDFPLNTWLHIVAVREGTYAYGYVNGELKNSANLGAIADYLPNPLTIGRGYFDDDFAPCMIGIICIYNRALSSDEIKQHYELTKKYFE